MKMPELPETESRLQAVVRTYSEVIRTGIVMLGWTVAGLAAGCLAFLVLRVVWWFVTFTLKVVGGL